VTEIFLKGGFGFLIFRELFANLKRIFTDRKNDLRLAGILKDEVAVTTDRIAHFNDGMNAMIQANAGKAPDGFQYLPDFLPPLDSVYKQQINKLFPIFEKHSPNSSKELHQLYARAESYKTLLGFYQERFMGSLPVSTRKDPHLSFQKKAQSMGLHDVGTIRNSIFLVIDKVQEGNWFWKLARKKFIYLILKVVMLIFLFILPERDAL
jgi:hypothetical protein